MAAQAAVYTRTPASDVSDMQLEACAQLFSNHYGVWGQGSGREPGSRVRLSAPRLKAQCLFNEACFLCTASVGGTLVGHAFVTNFPYNSSSVSWITQLCVHNDYRGRHIASQLCRMAWDVSSEFACGLASSHPYAVRALERATQRRCNPTMIMQHGRNMVAASGIPYLSGCGMSTSGACALNTSFFVDHTEVDRLAAAVPGWCLGSLPDGEEYLAVIVTEPSWHRGLGGAAAPSTGAAAAPSTGGGGGAAAPSTADPQHVRAGV